MIAKELKKKINLSPTQILVVGFLFLIVLGTILLCLPIASTKEGSIGFVDSVFTATSAVCVTGLVVFETATDFTLFGQLVILMLIQIGGLGFMTITTAFFILLGKKITLKERLVIQEALNQYSISGMVRLTQKIIFGTFIIEGVGALLLSIRLIPKEGFFRGIYLSIFHSISAFCNAGFAIFTDSSLTGYYNDILVNLVIISLIILGGLGFAVWWDIIKVSKEKREKKYTMKKWFNKLMLHTKIVLVMTSILLVSGFVFFFVVESYNPDTLGVMGLKDRTITAAFQSVTTRTAGFNSIPLEDMTYASKFLTIILMFIGGSPGGTAGGIKTVTVAVILLSIISVIRGKERIEAFNRTIPFDALRRAITVFFISLGVVISVTIMLTLSETGSFMNIFFEATSAFATVGLSLDFTSTLSTFGKIIISITMFIGRLGPVTMALAFTLKNKHQKGQVKKPEEKVMVG